MATDARRIVVLSAAWGRALVSAAAGGGSGTLDPDHLAGRLAISACFGGATMPLFQPLSWVPLGAVGYSPGETETIAAMDIAGNKQADGAGTVAVPKQEK